MNGILFSLGSVVIAPFWLLMILVPGHRLTARAVASPLIAVGPALLYAGLALPELTTLLPAVLRPTLPAIAALLGTDDGAVLAWTHFLAFDLLVGRAFFLEARSRGVSAWLSSPVLFFTLMLGPLGWLGGQLVLARARSSST